MVLGAVLKAATEQWLKSSPLTYVASAFALLTFAVLWTRPHVPSQAATTLAGAAHVDIAEEASAVHTWLTTLTTGPWVTIALAVVAFVVSAMALRSAACATSTMSWLRHSNPDPAAGVRRAVNHVDFVLGRQQQCASTAIVCLALIVEIEGSRNARLHLWLFLAAVGVLLALATWFASRAVRIDNTYPNARKAAFDGLEATTLQLAMMLRVAFYIPVRLWDLLTTGSSRREDQPPTATG